MPINTLSVGVHTSYRWLIFVVVLLPFTVKKSLTQAQTSPRTNVISDSLYSSYLTRTVTLTQILPGGSQQGTFWSVLILFDGQDSEQVGVRSALESFYTNSGRPVLVVGVHANTDRIHEYGISSQPDYADRGGKALQTTQFVIHELLPHLQKMYPLSKDRKDWSVAGFSLGGLMALDLAWNHAEVFAQVGVFSGAFWWRSKALGEGYRDSDRIMHRIVRTTRNQPPLRFWFQTGTHDETDDRDNDGVIDSIDDTLDLIAELERKGYKWGSDIHYEEVKEGEHSPQTWGRVFPAFMDWLYRK
jgi:enterochelin esterase-like enzyme